MLFVSAHALNRFRERTGLAIPRDVLAELVDRGQPEPHARVGQLRVLVVYDGIVMCAIIEPHCNRRDWVVLTFLRYGQAQMTRAT